MSDHGNKLTGLTPENLLAYEADPRQILSQFEAWMDAKNISWDKLSPYGVGDYAMYLAKELYEDEPQVKVQLAVILNQLRMQLQARIRRLYDREDVDQAGLQKLEARIRNNADHFFGIRVDIREGMSRAERQEVYQELLHQLKTAPLFLFGYEFESEEERAHYTNVYRYSLSEWINQAIRHLHDDGHIQLTPRQAIQLLSMPDTATAHGLRDKTIIALLLSTGVREIELRAIDVPDLRYQLHGTPALHVPDSPGCAERLIPYGNMIWALRLAEQWLERVNITQGPVLRGFYRGGESIRKTRLDVKSIRTALAKYPIPEDGTTVTPLDLRRTYARRLYVAGMDLVAIQENLGVTDLKTVADYIGIRPSLERIPPSVYPIEADIYQDDTVR